jgi:H+-transporting ATPase
LCKLDKATQKDYDDKIVDLAADGTRALYVAYSSDGGRSWTLLGILPLLDPPRPDAKKTIERAEALSLSVKMVTGDDVAIGGEISRQLGLGSQLLVASDAFGANPDPENITGTPRGRCTALSHVYI